MTHLPFELIYIILENLEKDVKDSLAPPYRNDLHHDRQIGQNDWQSLFLTLSTILNLSLASRNHRIQIAPRLAHHLALVLKQVAIAPWPLIDTPETEINVHGSVRSLLSLARYVKSIDALDTRLQAWAVHQTLPVKPWYPNCGPLWQAVKHRSLCWAEFLMPQFYRLQCLAPTTFCPRYNAKKDRLELFTCTMAEEEMALKRDEDFEGLNFREMEKAMELDKNSGCRKVLFKYCRRYD
ncbi:uncharacterized protein KY384_000778 [Bacidia gigantensis]|uniref:uncharacterized protein n=1 Tax=Bacidia gigantensis TaxID=2732470 RepID=UPI001D04F9DD|nr:uncharacterized protein KY384_000778 [Bacidia gigantensis]KAG8526016.1 hypothetical protein KY384_000778 [Bacidia gigantensis]